MMQAQENETLPSLSPSIKLYKAAPSQDGEMRWTLHHKISNKYFQIGWLEFECLARFHRCQTIKQLEKTVNQETTLNIDAADIRKLLEFLQSNGLVASKDQILTQKYYQKAEKPKSFWKTVLHGYLYFTVPLFKPEAFLKRTLPYVAFAFSKRFLQAAFALLILGIILTSQRPDEFANTFTALFTLEGALLTLITFTLIKIMHELGHAYAAIRHGVSVPHMGVAFMVLYPMLYTETTAAWQISSPRKRAEIALAGVSVELILSSVFLMLWNILPDGLLKSLCFNAVIVSLLGSLLINLNPLMRFDGYYVLSDLIGIENLHHKAISFARWQLRRTLFNLQDPEPFDVSEPRKAFLINFGFAVLIYRFFLFFGIALLVYHLFFKPLGLILMVIELGFFIVLPIVYELKIWWRRRRDILIQKRSKIFIGSCLVVLFLCFFPLDTTVSAPAVMQATEHRSFYSPAPAHIAKISITEGQRVSKGEILIILESDALEHEWKKTKNKVTYLKTVYERSQTVADMYKQKNKNIEQELAAENIRLKSLEEQRALLTLSAPFDGVIRDLSAEIHVGRAVKPSDLMFRLLQPKKASVYGFIKETDFERLEPGNFARFRPAYSLIGGVPLTLEKLEPVSTKNMAWPELASVYKGPLPTALSASKEMTSLEPLYTVYLHPTESIDKYQDLTIPGRVEIQARNSSLALSAIDNTIRIFRRELNLN